MKFCRKSFYFLFTIAVVMIAARRTTAEPSPAVEQGNPDVFRRENLSAWCIVPYDSQARDSEARARMLAKLGFKHFAYDYRKEHIPTFETEIEACRRHGIEIDAWWFPPEMNDDARQILEACTRQGIRPQLWVGLENRESDERLSDDERARVVAERLRPIVEAAAQHNLKVGLYNHLGWCGEPDNLLAVLNRLAAPNVGIVYNLFHAHAEIDRFDQSLKQMQPHLLAVNLSGMNRHGDRHGQKFLQLGQGELDLQLLRSIVESGYQGRIGIVGHTDDDAELRLLDNLDGLDWITAQLRGDTNVAKPIPRTPIPPWRLQFSRRQIAVAAAWGLVVVAVAAYAVVRLRRSRTANTAES